jgi:adenylylsulfate kinase
MTLKSADNKNIPWHHATVTRVLREKMNHHRSAALWFTGFSGSGKSTLAHAVEERLHAMGCHTYVFDGDNVRHGLCSDLGFSKEARTENIRRIGEMVKLFVDAGVISLSAFISPFRADRDLVRNMIGENDFIEIYCQCPLEVCERRDVKGHYRKARAGEIKEFTGISSPYEEPESPDLTIDTGGRSLEECANIIVKMMQDRGIVQRI